MSYFGRRQQATQTRHISKKMDKIKRDREEMSNVMDEELKRRERENPTTKNHSREDSNE